MAGIFLIVLVYGLLAFLLIASISLDLWGNGGEFLRELEIEEEVFLAKFNTSKAYSISIKYPDGYVKIVHARSSKILTDYFRDAEGSLICLTYLSKEYEHKAKYEYIKSYKGKC